MATAAASRPSGPVLSIPSYHSAASARVKLTSGGAARSPAKSVSVSSSSSSPARGAAAKSGRSCMCSPTNHPGSFRCGLHKERKQAATAGNSKPGSPPSSIGSGCSKRPGGTLAQLVPMESGHWARRALAPSPATQQSLQRRRAGGFRPRPSRLSTMSMAGDRPVNVNNR